MVWERGWELRGRAGRWAGGGVERGRRVTAGDPAAEGRPDGGPGGGETGPGDLGAERGQGAWVLAGPGPEVGRRGAEGGGQVRPWRAAPSAEPSASAVRDEGTSRALHGE